MTKAKILVNEVKILVNESLRENHLPVIHVYCVLELVLIDSID